MDQLPAAGLPQLVNGNILAVVRIMDKAMAHNEFHLMLRITLKGRRDTYHDPHLGRRKQAQSTRRLASHLKWGQSTAETGHILDWFSSFQQRLSTQPSAGHLMWLCRGHVTENHKHNSMI